MYKLVPLNEVLKYVPEAEKEEVSKVARGRGGFLEQYKKGQLNEFWKNKRENFIKRHLAQYRKNPTRRRWLALMMWAFKA